MTLPNPGVSLSLANIQTEFGGANPAKLSEYYAGGAYVPAGTTGYYGAIPSSGTIAISDFYGSSNGFFIAATTGPPVSFPYNYFTGAASSITGPSTIGTFLQSTITVSAVTYTVRGVYDIYYADFSGSGSYFIFAVTGNHTGAWWSSITVNGNTFSRAADCSPATGTYDVTDNITYWQPPPASNKVFGVAPASTYGLTVT